MAGRNNRTTQQCSTHMRCPDSDVAAFYKAMGGQVWQVNALLLASALLAAVIVGIGAYGQRYRFHYLARFVFLGATTLFLPIISSVVSTVSDHSNDYVSIDGELLTALTAFCVSSMHPCAVITFAFLVQLAAVSTSAVVAADDREGRTSAGPRLELLIQGVWTFYLGVSSINKLFFYGLLGFQPAGYVLGAFALKRARIMLTPFVFICGKIMFQCYAFQMARQSFALGRNPGLVFGHMEQLQRQEESQFGGEPPAVGAPQLLVMGEEARPVEKQPQGYAFSDHFGTTDLVTLDRIWQLDSGVLPALTPRLKDLCLSFALFKLLRCRFAGYKLANAGSLGTLNFFWSLLLKDGDHDRVFRVIVDELSFLDDFYYSSLPISYSKYWLPILSMSISLLSIGYCIVVPYFIVTVAQEPKHNLNHQILCRFWCNNKYMTSKLREKEFGSLYFDLVPVFLLLTLVMVAEVRHIASYIFSNWTKVSLVCHYVTNASRNPHPFNSGMPKWVHVVLQSRCRLLKQWDDKLGQCSVLELHPSRATAPALVRRLLGLPDRKRKVTVPAAVKVCIMDTLRCIDYSNGRRLAHFTTSLRRSPTGQTFLWACSGKGTSDIILTWHIATSILEVRHPYRRDDALSMPGPDHKSAAIHLSRYLAYLVTWCPELLPDDEAWSTSLYMAVKKDAEGSATVHGHAASRVPPASTPLAEYEQLVGLLSANSTHEVLRNGVRLGQQLVEESKGAGEETAWAALAGFWSEMILYVAPSDNGKGHAEAIARGGELVTLLWALLTHAGIDNRPGDVAGVATSASGVV